MAAGQKGRTLATLNPRTTHYEFGGPLGAFAISVGLSALVEMFFFGCNDQGCPPSLHTFLYKLRTAKLLSWSATGVYLLWLGGLAVLDIILPGEVVRGTELRTGDSLMYKFNGTYVALLLLSLLGYRAWSTSLYLPELQFVYEHLLELANASILVAVCLSTYLYFSSFGIDAKTRKPKLLALGGNSGNFIYDWFIGRELNPRWGPLDLKLFLEMRPGLLLWIIINLAMMHHQFLKFGNVSISIVLVTVFQAYYVLEGTFYETGLVSMIDTTTDGLGFMLVFGDISLVPFTYTIQARYLADHQVHLSWLAVALIVGVYISGIMIFRLSNNEKNRFRAGDPSTAHLKYITSESGSKLLVTGWWGAARHVNYFGDWLGSWAYCLPCGTAVIPYYFVVFFFALLIHRNERDEAKCAAKYGKTWDEYKRRVPYKFIPYVY